MDRTLSTISIKKYEQGIEALIDLNTCPTRIRSDYVRRNDNVLAGEKLCKRCDGTGNELMYWYSRCPACDGTGIMRSSSSIEIGGQDEMLLV